jgi:hypothetical protein
VAETDHGASRAKADKFLCRLLRRIPIDNSISRQTFSFAAIWLDEIRPASERAT